MMKRFISLLLILPLLAYCGKTDEPQPDPDPQRVDSVAELAHRKGRKVGKKGRKEARKARKKIPTFTPTPRPN